jgi:Family of unknown function (DUF6529)
VPALDVASSYADLMTSVFSAPIAAKAWFATAAIVLALIQISTAARMWGHLRGIVPLGDGAAATVHRWSGRLAVLCTLPVVFHCVFILGFETTDARVAVHSIVGSFIYGVLAAKLIAVRVHGYPGWVLPAAGGTLFASLAVLWLTSSLWYFTNVEFGF